MWKMDHERWVRERRAEAYVRLTTQVLHYAQAVADLPDDVPSIGEYLRARSPYKDPYGQETGQLIIAFGTPDMVRLMLSFGDIQCELDQLGGKRDQVPSLVQRLEQIQDDMDDVAVRDIQRNGLLVGPWRMLTLKYQRVPTLSLFHPGLAAPIRGLAHGDGDVR